jgi:adenylylsulfate kinase-like enzyme
MPPVTIAAMPARRAPDPVRPGGAPVRGDLTPVLWLCGPPGVGKTAVGWHLFSELTQAGVQAGFVDIDQLGMCYPEPLADPGRHRMKAQNVSAVIANFRAAGACCVVVSGVVDPAVGVHTDLLADTALTICRLRADHDELRRRLADRSGQSGPMDEVTAEAAALDAGDFADVCVDTSGAPAADVVRQVRERCGDWTGQNHKTRATGAAVARPTATAAADAAGESAGEVAAAGGHILLLCGATSVGKSTIGFELYLRDLKAGLTAAYIDLDQIGFCGPALAGHQVSHLIKARNLAALWRTYRTAGASHLIAVGPVQNEAAYQAYAEALPAASITLGRLHAGPAELRSRVMSRGLGGSWPQPGDPLAGQPAAHLHRVADQAAADAAALEQVLTSAARIDTDKCTVEEAADLIAAVTGWPDPGRR